MGTPRWARRDVAVTLSFVWLCVSACQHDSQTPPALVADSALYWSLDADHRAVTLALTAPYDTLRIAAVPHNRAGEALTTLPTPKYTSRDPERVGVTADGVLRAIALTGSEPVVVAATLTAGNLKHIDSVFVKVMDTAPWVLDSLSIHPLPPDSAKAAARMSPFRALPVRVVNTDGIVISDLLVAFRSSNIAIAGVGPTTGKIDGYRPGFVALTASATAFGVTKVDTLTYRIGWPLFAIFEVGPDNSFNVANATIGTGGVVYWEYTEISAGLRPAGSTMHVTFDDPTNVVAVNPAPSYSILPSLICAFFSSVCDASGNFVLTFTNTSDDVSQMLPGVALRRFSVPGIYEFHTDFGTGTRITVVDER